LSRTALTDGDVLFARYAYPPNQLGYCGEGDSTELLELASRAAGGVERPFGAGAVEVSARARGFDGAWPYLEMIAAAGRLEPLDARVVEAYWIGNQLLDTVDPGRFAAEVRERFATQSGAEWGCLAPTNSLSPLPHHSFHVLAIYPWMGLLRRGSGGPALHVLDRCRIRWGEVVSVTGDQAEVRCQALAWDGHRLALGPGQLEHARWADGGRSLLGSVSPGEWVALHWDWVCDTLTETQLEALIHFTARQLEATNACG
jgi:Family of unknown function (DUF6390)